jgi:hypothetical protein
LSVLQVEEDIKRVWQEKTLTTQVLVGYATRYGSTQEVAQALAPTLGERRPAIDLLPLKEVRPRETNGLLQSKTARLNPPGFMLIIADQSAHRSATW